ncbi:MAG: hypothetical protein JKY81_10620 [Colwellia sp.]|nr:hypothetical protein [Colwellia sp.]
MSDPNTSSSSETVSETSKEQGISSQKLNLILAICAILISAASFYATYLQANAAEKQVKAMTLPLLQYVTGNASHNSKESVVAFNVTNGGVGPALIKSFNFFYKKKKYQTFEQFLQACCQKEYMEYQDKVAQGVTRAEGLFATRGVVNTILPSQESNTFYQLYLGEKSKEFWHKLDDERFNLGMEICYCSLLDECYSTQGKGVVEPVETCPVEN